MHEVRVPLVYMPAIIRRCGSRWCVYAHKGKRARRHTSKKKALAQQKAVNRSLRQKGKIR